MVLKLLTNQANACSVIVSKNVAQKLVLSLLVVSEIMYRHTRTAVMGAVYLLSCHRSLLLVAPPCELIVAGM